MSQEIISLVDFNPGELSTLDEACAKRDEILLRAQTVVTITDKDSAQSALDVLKDLKSFTNSIEAARKEVKAPVLARAEQIDSLAKSLTRDLTEEYNRIAVPLGKYNQEQQKKAEEARRLAWEEEQRIVRAAQEKERMERAAADRIQRELEEKASRARSDAKAQEYAAIAEVKAQQAEVAAEQRAVATTQAIIDTRVAAHEATPGKIAGMSTRKNVEFEVTDIVALYEAAPFLVNLTPNVAALKSALKNLSEGQNLPGVKHWFSHGVTLR